MTLREKKLYLINVHTSLEIQNLGISFAFVVINICQIILCCHWFVSEASVQKHAAFILCYAIRFSTMSLATGEKKMFEPAVASVLSNDNLSLFVYFCKY